MIKFDENYHLYDITPLENMFIQQYLVKSPGDYVKIYIYCLNMCYYPDGSAISYSTIASSLKLSEEDVRRALRYWTKLGILTVAENNNGILEIEMHSTTEMHLDKDSATAAGLYRYKDFNNKLNDAFYPRILDSQDFVLYDEMPEVFKVSEEYVIEAVKYSIRVMSTEVPYRYVEKVIEAWKDDGINDVAALGSYIEQKEGIRREISSILKYLGMNRQPTVPEINCYKKWKNDYGFSFDTIKEACNETLSANNPTIKYLDSIMTALREKNLGKPAAEAASTKESTEAFRNKTRKLLFYLGIRKAPSAIQVQKYQKWEQDYGYCEEAITLASSLINTNGNPFDALDNILESLHMKGIITPDDINDYIEKKSMYDSEIMKIQQTLGTVSDISDFEREYLKAWRNDLGLSSELVLYAASIAVTAEKPWRYMNSILSSWKKIGIETVKQAEEFNMPHDNDNKTNITSKKKPSFVTDVESHKYTDEDYDKMFDNFGDFKKND